MGKEASAHTIFTVLGNSIENRYEFLTGIYEEGMTAVLREIAVAKMLEWEEDDSKERPCQQKEALCKVEMAYKKLGETLNATQRGLLITLDSEFGGLMSTESKEYFVAGFIAGYRFIKQLKES